MSSGQASPAFRWRICDEDVLIVGAKGEGKTTLAKTIMKLVPSNILVIVWDFSNQFGNMGRIIHDNWRQLLEMQGVVIVQATDKTKENYFSLCKFIFENLYNVVFVSDEIHQNVTKQSIDRELYELVMSGRNKGICNLFISTGTTAIPNYIIKNCSHAFAMIHYLESDVLWLSKNIGPKCWMLLPQDKRRQVNQAKAYWDQPDLPKHSYIYRDMHGPECFVLSGGSQP